MLRDWLLTLAVLSPTFLALLIALFALMKRIARHEPVRSTIAERSRQEGGMS